MTKMIISRLSFAAIFLIASGVGFAAPPPRSFRMIVNAANPVSALTEEQVARIFLKKAARWPDGASAIPIDQHQDSLVRQQFSTAILGRDVGPIKSYWQQMIFSGRNVPPLEVVSDAQVLAQVRGAKDAIGYVGLSADLGGGVKEIMIEKSDRKGQRR